MRFQVFEKYQFVIWLLIGIYFSKNNVDASLVQDSDTSDGATNQLKDHINLNKFSSKKKFQCPGLFGAFPDVEDCSRFYLCVAGISQNLPCPRMKQFDKYRRKCVSMIIAICDKGKDKKTTTVPDKEVTSEKDPIFLCPSMFGSFPHTADCSKYYKCTFFVPVLNSCPEKKLFDGVKKECKPESEVNCGSRNRPTSETTLATTPLVPKSSPREITIAPEPTTTEATTPEPTTPEVTTPEASINPEATTLEATTMEEQTAPETDCDEDDLDCIITETGEIPEWFKCPVQIGSHRHPSSKKLFIFCINWKPYVKRCGQDLIYSKEIGTCIEP